MTPICGIEDSTGYSGSFERVKALRGGTLLSEVRLVDFTITEGPAELAASIRPAEAQTRLNSCRSEREAREWIVALRLGDLNRFRPGSARSDQAQRP